MCVFLTTRLPHGSTRTDSLFPYTTLVLSRSYEVAVWARIPRTVAVAIIVVLAVPFAFGPMRSTGTGARTVVGIMIGVVFFLMAKMLESGGEVDRKSTRLNSSH